MHVYQEVEEVVLLQALLVMMVSRLVQVPLVLLPEPLVNRLVQVLQEPKSVELEPVAVEQVQERPVLLLSIPYRLVLVAVVVLPQNKFHHVVVLLRCRTLLVAVVVNSRRSVAVDILRFEVQHIHSEVLNNRYWIQQICKRTEPRNKRN